MSIKDFVGGNGSTEERLRVLDELDFTVFNKQAWGRLAESHAEDVLVTWPDGRQTRGLKPHIEDLETFFSFIPDATITEHPVRFGAGEYTCLVSTITGTFTKPMPVPGGGHLAPTGKSFRLTMVNVNRWKDGKIIEETIIWDNLEFARQLGIAPKMAELVQEKLKQVA